MRKLIIKCLFVILLILTAISCNTKDRYLTNFEKFIEDVEQSGAEYSNEDWENVSDEYDAFVGDYLEQYSDQLTKEDYKQIGRLKARYHKAWIKYASSQISNAISASSQIAAGYLEEMANDCGMDEMDLFPSEEF